VLNRNPWIVYPGNLQGRDIRETGAKGCVVVDTDGDQVTNVEPVAVDVVRWQETRIDIASIDSISKLPASILVSLDSSYRACDGRPCATRVIFEGTGPIAAEMLRRPDWLHQTVMESAAEISDELWLEQLVNNAIAPTVDSSRVSSASDIDLEQLIAGVDATALRSALLDDFETIKSKLPDALKSHPSLALVESDKALLIALRRLAPKLASRLTGERLP
jgi:DNA repair exonuclease SbcCD nuclease subunit